MLTAITRAVSRSIGHCELTHLERQPIDLELARRQHDQYEQALRAEGVEVLTLPEEPALPDSVFVEDTAIVLEDCAILTRPGAKSRQPEVEIHCQEPWRSTAACFPSRHQAAWTGVTCSLQAGRFSLASPAAATGRRLTRCRSCLPPLGTALRVSALMAACT